jgi:leader peptidase (prepilin peptidase)/N-methyltransferase
MIEALIFICGLFFGSFFGVLIDRIPKEEEVVAGRSRCDYCKKEIKWYDLIPVVSFIILRGKCRYCKKKLSYYYPLLEILTGILFVFTFIYFYQVGVISFIYNLIILSSLFVIFFMDLKFGIIPDKIIFPAFVLTLMYYFFFQNTIFFNHMLSGIGAFLFLFGISYGFYFFTKKDGMGGGDIKLSFLLGFFLGFPKILVALYIAFLTGAIIAIILVLWKKKRFQKDTLPFGPFLISASFISLVLGDKIYHLFLQLLGF